MDRHALVRESEHLVSLPNFDRIKPFVVGEHRYTGEYIQTAVSMRNGIDQEMREVGAWIAFFGAVTSDAKKIYDRNESEYRRERDVWKQSQIGRSPKPTKTALDDEWRTQPEYVSWYEKQNEAERAWNITTYVYEALLRKANMLSALGRLEVDNRFASPATSAPPGA